MQKFTITIKTATSSSKYFALAMTAVAAFEDAANAQGDIPCGITVVPAKASV